MADYDVHDFLGDCSEDGSDEGKDDGGVDDLLMQLDLGDNGASGEDDDGVAAYAPSARNLEERGPAAESAARAAATPAPGARPSRTPTEEERGPAAASAARLAATPLLAAAPSRAPPEAIAAAPAAAPPPAPALMREPMDMLDILGSDEGSSPSSAAASAASAQAPSLPSPVLPPTAVAPPVAPAAASAASSPSGSACSALNDAWAAAAAAASGSDAESEAASRASPPASARSGFSFPDLGLSGPGSCASRAATPRAVDVPAAAEEEESEQEGLGAEDQEEENLEEEEQEHGHEQEMHDAKERATEKQEDREARPVELDMEEEAEEESDRDAELAPRPLPVKPSPLPAKVPFELVDDFAPPSPSSPHWADETPTPAAHAGPHAQRAAVALGPTVLPPATLAAPCEPGAAAQGREAATTARADSNAAVSAAPSATSYGTRNAVAPTTSGTTKQGRSGRVDDSSSGEELDFLPGADSPPQTPRAGAQTAPCISVPSHWPRESQRQQLLTLPPRGGRLGLGAGLRRGQTAGLEASPPGSRSRGSTALRRAATSTVHVCGADLGPMSTSPTPSRRALQEVFIEAPGLETTLLPRDLESAAGSLEPPALATTSPRGSCAGSGDDPGSGASLCVGSAQLGCCGSGGVQDSGATAGGLANPCGRASSVSVGESSEAVPFGCPDKLCGRSNAAPSRRSSTAGHAGSGGSALSEGRASGEASEEDCVWEEPPSIPNSPPAERSVPSTALLGRRGSGIRTTHAAAAARYGGNGRYNTTRIANNAARLANERVGAARRSALGPAYSEKLPASRPADSRTLAQPALRLPPVPAQFSLPAAACTAPPPLQPSVDVPKDSEPVPAPVLVSKDSERVPAPASELEVHLRRVAELAAEAAVRAQARAQHGVANLLEAALEARSEHGMQVPPRPRRGVATAEAASTPRARSRSCEARSAGQATAATFESQLAAITAAASTASPPPMCPLGTDGMQSPGASPPRACGSGHTALRPPSAMRRRSASPTSRGGGPVVQDPVAHPAVRLRSAAPPPAAAPAAAAPAAAPPAAAASPLAVAAQAAKAPTLTAEVQRRPETKVFAPQQRRVSRRLAANGAEAAGSIAAAREEVLRMHEQVRALSAHCDTLEAMAADTPLAPSGRCSGGEGLGAPGRAAVAPAAHACAMRAAQEHLAALRAQSTAKPGFSVEPCSEALRRMREWVAEIATESANAAAGMASIPPVPMAAMAAPDAGAGPAALQRPYAAAPSWTPMGGGRQPAAPAPAEDAEAARALQRWLGNALAQLSASTAEEARAPGRPGAYPGTDPGAHAGAYAVACAGGGNAAWPARKLLGAA